LERSTINYFFEKGCRIVEKVEGKVGGG